MLTWIDWQAWIIGITTSVLASVAVVVVFRLFLDTSLDKVKRRLEELRKVSKTKKEVARKKETIEIMVYSVSDRDHNTFTYRSIVNTLSCVLVGTSTLAFACVSLFVIDNVFFGYYMGFLAFVTYAFGVGIFIHMSVSLLPRWQVEIMFGNLVQRIYDAIRDVATKDEIRELAVLRLAVSDGDTLVGFLGQLYVTAQKYNLEDHIGPLIIPAAQNYEG